MPKKYLVYLLWALFFRETCIAQVNDISVTIHETTLNKLFKALGEIKGSSEYKILFVKGTYHWTLINPSFRLLNDKADFVTNVKVKAGVFEYETQVVGNVDIQYDPRSNKVLVKVVKATFPIYTEILGRKFHIKDIDLEKYFEKPFTFEGPLSMKAEMEFDLPDGTKKKLYANPKNCALKVEPLKIQVNAEVEFTDQPPPPAQPEVSVPVKDTTDKK